LSKVTRSVLVDRQERNRRIVDHGAEEPDLLASLRALGAEHDDGVVERLAERFEAGPRPSVKRWLKSSKRIASMNRATAMLVRRR
jgi:hypothetical protein